MTQLKMWSSKMLKKIQQKGLKKTPKTTVSKALETKLFENIKWTSENGDVLPRMITIKSLKTWSWAWLLRLRWSHLPPVRITSQHLRKWSQLWLTQILKIVILQEEVVTRIIKKIQKHHKDKLFCPSLEMKIANPLKASIEFAKHAAKFLDINHEGLLRDISEGKKISIAGWSAKLVLGLIYQTVNCERFKRGGVFEFELRSSGNGKRTCLIIRLEAKPTENQPGNGRVSLHVICNGNEDLFDKGEVFQVRTENVHTMTYEEILRVLELSRITGSALATKLCTLFRSCGDVMITENKIHHLYFLLLFEIGRRMVYVPFKSFEARLYDKLPVAVSITKILHLLQRELISPSDVFGFSIFRGSPDQREERMKNIEGLYAKHQDKNSQQSSDYIGELENAFNPK